MVATFVPIAQQTRRSSVLLVAVASINRGVEAKTQSIENSSLNVPCRPRVPFDDIARSTVSVDTTFPPMQVLVPFPTIIGESDQSEMGRWLSRINSRFGPTKCSTGALEPCRPMSRAESKHSNKALPLSAERMPRYQRPNNDVGETGIPNGHDKGSRRLGICRGSRRSTRTSAEWFNQDSVCQPDSLA